MEDLESAIKIVVDNLKNEDNNIEILGKTQNYSLTMYLSDDISEKEYVRFIKSTERTIRSNPDYKDFLTFIREDQNLDHCAFFKRVSSKKAEIQLHHYPFTLFDICTTVANKMFSSGEKISSMILADEVLKLHFDMKVGLVPLSCTMHELVHATGIRIPTNSITGLYRDFYEEYRSFVPDDYHELIRDLEERPFITKESLSHIKLLTEENENGSGEN